MSAHDGAAWCGGDLGGIVKIGDFRAQVDRLGTRVSARLRWEDVDRPDDTLYFASSRVEPSELMERPEAFFLAAFPLALWHGEGRVRTEGVLCPRLEEGVRLAIERMVRWHPRLRSPKLEAAGGLVASEPLRDRRSGMLLSGGIDSMSLLRRNRVHYPAGHPGRVRTAYFCFGFNSFDFEDGVAVPGRRDAMLRYGDRLGAFVRGLGIDFVTVETNGRGLYPSYEAWGAVGWGMTTAAAGLSSARGISDLWVASNGQGLEVRPRTAHLDLAPWVSPAALDFRVGERVASRVDETRLVAEWEGAGDVVRSCLWLDLPDPPAINCGHCEKCVRTMLTLVAIDRPGAMSSFPTGTLTARMVERVAGAVTLDTISYYRPLPALLRDVGRDDLAPAVESLIQGVPADPSPRPGIWGRLFGSRV